MKTRLFVIALALALLAGCKCTKTGTGTQSDNISHGVVSHQYRATGCPTVILIAQKDGSEPATLIPKDPIPSKLDKDGTKVALEYTPLRMPNPEGCSAGFPAEILSIRKDK